MHRLIAIFLALSCTNAIAQDNWGAAISATDGIYLFITGEMDIDSVIVHNQGYIHTQSYAYFSSIGAGEYSSFRCRSGITPDAYTGGDALNGQFAVLSCDSTRRPVKLDFKLVCPEGTAPAIDLNSLPEGWQARAYCKQPPGIGPKVS